jgi:uncharacterized protein YjiS (DUF1127 family)
MREIKFRAWYKIFKRYIYKDEDMYDFALTEEYQEEIKTNKELKKLSKEDLKDLEHA